LPRMLISSHIGAQIDDCFSTSSMLYQMSLKPEVYSEIRIFLQRADQPDDVLIVKPDNHSQWYDMTFKQNTLGVTTTNSFLRCLLIDEDKCSHVQVDIPSYPTVILKLHNIPSYYTLLRQKVLNIISHWPLDESP